MAAESRMLISMIGADSLSRGIAREGGIMSIDSAPLMADPDASRKPHAKKKAAGDRDPRPRRIPHYSKDAYFTTT